MRWFKFKRKINRWWNKGELPDKIPILELSDEQKEALVRHTIEIAGKPLLITYMMCQCKTHIEGTIYNDPTGEFFKLTFIKIAEEPKTDKP